MLVGSSRCGAWLRLLSRRKRNAVFNDTLNQTSSAVKSKSSGRRNRIAACHSLRCAQPESSLFPKAAWSKRGKALKAITHPEFFVRSQRDGDIRNYVGIKPPDCSRYKYPLRTHPSNKEPLPVDLPLRGCSRASPRQRNARDHQISDTPRSV